MEPKNCHFRAQTSTSHPCNWGPWWRSSGPPSSRTWSWLSATVGDHECPQWPPFCLISSFHKAYISLPWLRFPKCFMISHGTALSSTLRNNSSRAWRHGKVKKYWSAAINSARVGRRHWSGGCRDGDTWNCKIAQSNNKFLWNVSTALWSFTHVRTICAYYVDECWRWFRLLRGQFSKCTETLLVQCGHVEKFHAASPSKPQLNGFIIYGKSTQSLRFLQAAGSLPFSNQSHTIFVHCGLKTKQNVFFWFQFIGLTVKSFAWKDIGDPLENLFQHLIFPCVGLPCHSKWIPNWCF